MTVNRRVCLFISVVLCSLEAGNEFYLWYQLFLASALKARDLRMWFMFSLFYHERNICEVSDFTKRRHEVRLPIEAVSWLLKEMYNSIE